MNILDTVSSYLQNTPFSRSGLGFAFPGVNPTTVRKGVSQDYAPVQSTPVSTPSAASVGPDLGYREPSGGIQDLIAALRGILFSQDQQVLSPTVAGTEDLSPPYSMYANPYANTLRQVFGPEANTASRVLNWGSQGQGTPGIDYGGENTGFDPYAVNVNADGSRDSGLFQINENTFVDFANRHPQELAQLGIQSYQDMFDPLKNALMAKMIMGEQGYGAFYGAPPELRSQF